VLRPHRVAVGIYRRRGDALVRDVTYEDGSEVRSRGEGEPPQSFFRDFAHRLLTEIDREYPGLVLPHLAVPATPAPQRSHAGWNHRRNRRTAELNTELVLSRLNSSSFRSERDAWLSGQVEIKLVETKPLPFGNELRERRFTVPDHISVWPRASVIGYSRPVAPPDTPGGEDTGGARESSGVREDGGTRMRILSVYPSLEYLEKIEAMGAVEAFTQCVGQMDAVLAS
jgi:hypothetical protein